MPRTVGLFAVFAALCGPAAFQLAAAEPLTLENVVAPAENKADEPRAEKFSPAAATEFLDRASLDWQKRRKCFTCHTNYSYLLARPAISPADGPHRLVRGELEKLVQERWKEQGPRWDAEVVMSAAVLAHNDAATTGKLHAATRAALARMWTVQADGGGFNWLKCDWPPMESDDHYGVTMAAIAAGVAPEGYARTDEAKTGLAGIRKYLKNNPPPTPHHRAMILWASSYVDDLVTDAERKETVDRLFALQKKDGGWNLATLGNWRRADNSPQDTAASDGYATGFVIYALRRGGVAAADARIQKGVAWLKSNQRASGRWFTRSLHKDNKHFISHAGTAMAVLALAECGDIRPRR